MPRLSIGLEQVFTNLGIVGNGYKLFFFETGTTTPKTTYSNEGLSIQNTNPIVLNSAGRPDVGIWGSDPSLYRMILGTPDSVLGNITTVVDVDPVDNYAVDNIAGLSPIPTAYWGTTEGTSTAYTLDPALVDIISYSNEQTFFIDFHIACGANPNIDINDLGVLNLKKCLTDGTKTALVSNDVVGRHIAYNDGVDIVISDPKKPYLFGYNISESTETDRGTAELATQAETNARTDDLKIVTPLKLGFGFAISLATNGYIKFPAWLGGWILQWGAGVSNNVITFPIAFPTAALNVQITQNQISNVSIFAYNSLTTTNFTSQAWNYDGISVGGRNFNWFAIGY